MPNSKILKEKIQHLISKNIYTKEILTLIDKKILAINNEIKIRSENPPFANVAGKKFNLVNLRSIYN